jgi:hypothetical protein
LSEALVKGLFTLSETWYIETAAETPDQTFDISLVIEPGPSVGATYLYRFMDGAGHLVPTESIVAPDVSENSLRLRNVKPGNLLTLAFNLQSPAGVDLGFDLRIDGRDLPERVFIGESAEHPEAIPFSSGTAMRGSAIGGVPSQRPAPPYFLVWRAQGDRMTESPAPLTDDAKRGLRALGYIQ